MAEAVREPTVLRLSSRAGMNVEFNSNGALRRFDCGSICLPLFVGNELEGGPANLYLRHHSDRMAWTPLLGPSSPTRFHADNTGRKLLGTGSWMDIDYCLTLVLAEGAAAWFWHVRLLNTRPTAQSVDLTYAQDVALAPYGAIRLNEFYVSQYIDHTPLRTPKHGVAIASRQNQAVDGRHPWCLIGSLREGTSFATDALQFHGLASRAGDAPVGLVTELPGRRLQHEHSMVTIRDSRLSLEPRMSVAAGFFGSLLADHPDATSQLDLQHVQELFSLPEATAPELERGPARAVDPTTLFSAAPMLATLDLDTDSLGNLFGSERRHEERDGYGQMLSFFCKTDSHVVLRAKELRVVRPHGHVLRTGRQTTPDESGLTSTAWMSGVFHSMITEGHVSINRFLSTVHSYLGLFRSHGLRIFAQIGGAWQLLNVPSALEMAPNRCRWIYRHAAGLIQVTSEAKSDPHELTLCVEVLSGEPARFLFSHHIALNDDDGSTNGSARWSLSADEIVVTPAPQTDLGRRFPAGSFRIRIASGTEVQQVGGDELLFIDGASRSQPFLCIVTAPGRRAALSIHGNLIGVVTPTPLQSADLESLTSRLHMDVAPSSPLAPQLGQLADIAPWYAQNAWVHYLSPRGLEQFSGGGWGTRDVCQGPVELLLAQGRVEPIRDLLLRVMRAQNADGDWPQWFMFFERERGIRAGDSHGDIVFWPLVVLAQYLIASGDADVLDEQVPFFDSMGADRGELATVWQHARRALALIETRVVSGTALAAYGHGDWNDSLQPADPAMREHMCSAWTVTLHFQALISLAGALRAVGRNADVASLETAAAAVKSDFQRLLIVDGVLAGYALFNQGEQVRYLLHPSDKTTGVRYSSLAMIHAILEDLLTPAQAREHLQLIETQLSAPDGVRLFDRPMPYYGGPQRLFQRAETATFFGREIGLMYMHAHLRYAQALAHLGQAERFFHALCQANPVGIHSIVHAATARQANCYYSSSDAAFEDRYQADEQYDRVAQGTIGLDGGWRVYSSGAGIALSLIMRRFLGVNAEALALRVDPVIPAVLDGLRVEINLFDRAVQVHYHIKGAGCGVNHLTLNGSVLTFAEESNPYRRGAALVARAAVLEHLQTSGNHLRVDLG